MGPKAILSASQMLENVFQGRALNPAPLRLVKSPAPLALPVWPHSYSPTSTHLLTVIFSEFIQKPGSLLPSQVPQEGSQDRTDMLWVGKEKREHAVIRTVIITSLQAWAGSIEGGVSRLSLTAATD